MSDLNATPIYDETAWAHGFAPRPAPSNDDLMASLARILATTCARCEGDSLAPPECPPCLAEVERNRADMRDELAAFIRHDDGTDSGVNPHTGGTDLSRWAL